MLKLPTFACLSFLRLKPKTTHQPNQILAQLIANGLDSPTHLAKLIEQYCSISSARQAHLLFTQLHHPNLFLFNTLIRCNRPEDSIRLFANWVWDANFVFDESTYIYVLGSCARSPSLSMLWFGRQMHGRIFRLGFVSDLHVGTTLIHFYGRNGNIGSGRKVFDEMPERKVEMWNAMVTAYCSHRTKAKELYRNAVVLFRDLVAGGCGERPNATTVVCVLSASARLGVLETGACVHGYIQKILCMPEADVFIGTSLVDMYSKCGCLATALNVFKQVNFRNAFTWTAMATGLAIHGKGEEALEYLDAMVANGIKPNSLTFTSIFSACRHAGLVKEGLHLFRNMRIKFGLEPKIQHYGCIVDLLCKAGHLREAYQIIKEMPREPDAILWRILLNASQAHGDIELGEKVGRMLLELQSGKGSLIDDDASEDYVALSNIYALAEKWEDVELLRKDMKVKSIETKPGTTFVRTTANDVCRFVGRGH